MSEQRASKPVGGKLTEYSYTEAVEESKKYFNGDELAATVWANKYALKDSMGKIYENSHEQMHWRMAYEIERVEKKYPNPMSAAEVHGQLKGFK